MTTPPPMYPPPPAEGPKKTPIWVWIIAAVGGLIILGIIAVSLLGYFAYQKVKEVATNPTAMAALIAKVDPNLEVLDVDENKKVIHVRNKQNNEEVTLNMDDILQGKLKISHEGKDGTETMEIGGKVKLPSWMPKYPDADIKGVGAMSSDKDGAGGMYTFETPDSAEKIISFYREALDKQGFKNNEEASVKVTGSSVLAMKSDSDNHAVVTVNPNGSRSQVTVIYGSK